MSLKNIETRHLVLLSLFLLQLFCIGFLAFDVITEFFEIENSIISGQSDDQIEGIIVIALIASLVFSVLEIFRLYKNKNRLESNLKAASGAFIEVMYTRFNEWRLTKSEQDVALLAIKGLGITDIAEVRQTKEGTIKAQLNAIYNKAEVSGRPQFISLFIEELLGEGLTPTVSDTSE